MALTDVGGTPVVQTTGGYGGCDGLGFGGSGWLGIILIIALLGGGFWGNRGYGMGAGLEGALTRSDLQDGFYNQTIQNKIDALGGRINSIGDGLCNGFYQTTRDMLQMQNQTDRDLCSGFAATNNAIVENRFANQQCCCSIERAIDSVNFLGERNTNAVIQNASANTQKILDYLCNKDLADKNQQIFEMSQKAQTAEIIANMKPVAPVPAYLQPNPYEAYPYRSSFNGCNGCNFS